MACITPWSHVALKSIIALLKVLTSLSEQQPTTVPFFFNYKTALIELKQSQSTMSDWGLISFSIFLLLFLLSLWNWTEVKCATQGQGWMAANTLAKKQTKYTQKESGWVLDTRLLEAHCLWAPSVFIPGFVSHYDTYFSLKHKRLFVTIVSPVLALYGAAQ